MTTKTTKTPAHQRHVQKVLNDYTFIEHVNAVHVNDVNVCAYEHKEQNDRFLLIIEDIKNREFGNMLLFDSLRSVQNFIKDVKDESGFTDAFNRAQALINAI